jgi:hypothetical protein
MKWQFYLVLAAALCLAACGTPGAPRPPSLELPRPVADLAAKRQGDKVMLTWTAPRETTDKQNIRHPGPVHICRAVNTTAMVQCLQVAELPAASAATSRKEKPEQRSYTDSLPMDLQQQNPTGFATYALESLNPRGRSAGLSNHVEVPLAPTLPPPTQVKAEVTPEGIKISGYREELSAPPGGISYEVHVYRRENGGAGSIDMGPALEFQSGKNLYPAFTDDSIEWGKTYAYTLAVITKAKLQGGKTAEIPGDSSAEAIVTAADVFPPAAPAGLQAVASGVGQPPFVDLTWAPNTEADLAGYNLYRHQAGQEPVKINTELVKAPAYRDREVTAGHNYFYAVTAVDLRGNESPRSAEASESVP